MTQRLPEWMRAVADRLASEIGPVDRAGLTPAQIELLARLEAEERRRAGNGSDPNADGE